MTTSICAEFAPSASTQSDWVERGKKVLMQTYATQPMVLTEGQGSYVEDVDGKSYLDFASGIAVNSLGHCHPTYVEALTKQLSKLSHCSNLYYNQPAIELAEKLVANSAFDRAFFCNSGAEAVEGALKLSRKHAKKHKSENCTKILTMSNSFHGRTYGALSATAQTKYQEGYHPLVPDVSVVEFNNIASILANDLDAVAAIIIEPVQGEGGVHLVDSSFLKEVRVLCDKHNIVLIFDEIQCGVGRSGYFFASENFAVAPDIVALAKGLGGGFPIGAILAKESIASAFNAGEHGSTFGGNPMAASAALACVNIIGNEQFLGSVKTKSELLVAELVDLKSMHPSIKAIRGLGLMLGVEFDIPVKPIIEKCAAQGLLLVGAGENVIRFLPPLTVSDDEINEAIGILANVLGTQ
ncbi:aspartate aminotransferase family protein [bacterium]|nr:aspartate aminotransferase family protein [bacterium]MBP9809364.1 aspartate aminotransferase family protein [bacterium]